MTIKDVLMFLISYIFSLIALLIEIAIIPLSILIFLCKIAEKRAVRLCDFKHSITTAQHRKRKRLKHGR